MIIKPKFSGWDVLNGRVCRLCAHFNSCAGYCRDNKFESCKVAVSHFKRVASRKKRTHG